MASLAGIIIALLVITSVVILGTVRPRWLPNIFSTILAAIAAVILAIGAALPVLDPGQKIPTWVFEILGGLLILTIVAIIVYRWAVNKFGSGQSSRLREAVRTCFDVLSVNDKLTISQLKSRAEIQAGTTFDDEIWIKTVEILFKEKAIEEMRERQ